MSLSETFKIRHIYNENKKSSSDAKNRYESISCQTCKYFRSKDMVEVFDVTSMGPKGLCPDLTHSAYPYALAMLYGAVFDFENEPDVVNAQCPAPHGNVHFQVRREKLPKVEISKGVKKKVKIFIRITSIDDKAENCCCNQKVGAEYEFNQGDLLEQMCPAALYNIYPTIKAVTGHGKERWTKNGKTFVQCPDNFSKLKFEIETKKNKNLK